MIPIYTPYITNNENLIKAVNSGWFSNHGEFKKLAEDKLKEKIKSKFCILMNNGTSATHCIFLALKFKYPNIKKIYLPNNVFVAPLNCAIREFNYSNLEILKIDQDTLNIDINEECIKKLEKNSAVVIVHNIGNIINVIRLKRLRPDIIFIEDNCEGIFGKYENKFTGSVDEILCSSVSFYGNKTITTGEGGAFFTNHKDIYEYIKSIHEHSMTEERYIHNNIGYNYRMTNIAAAILCDQLENLDVILEKKRNIINMYRENLKSLVIDNKIKFLKSETNTESSNWVFFIKLETNNYKNLSKFLNDKNIDTRPFFHNVSKHKHLNKIKNIYENSVNDELVNSIMILPSYPELKEESIKYICENIKLFYTT